MHFPPYRLRTGPHVSLFQLLNAFPSSKPPLEHLMSVLQPLMPRFYSLSSDPHTTNYAHRRIIEIAVTVHESEDWATGKRTGVGSGFFERQALKYLENKGEVAIHVPMFRGLMQNPLAREFQPDGPMILIGAGVGIAPFRGFVQRRLQNANCANKVWYVSYSYKARRERLLTTPPGLSKVLETPCWTSSTLANGARTSRKSRPSSSRGSVLAGTCRKRSATKQIWFGS